MSDFTNCFSLDQINYFLSLIEVVHVFSGDLLTVFATDGPVFYLFNGQEYCIQEGIMS